MSNDALRKKKSYNHSHNLSAIILVSVPLTVLEMILPTSALYYSEYVVTGLLERMKQIASNFCSASDLYYSECVVIKECIKLNRIFFSFSHFLYWQDERKELIVFTHKISVAILWKHGMFFFCWGDVSFMHAKHALLGIYGIALTTNLGVLKCL